MKVAVEEETGTAHSNLTWLKTEYDLIDYVVAQKMEQEKIRNRLGIIEVRYISKLYSKLMMNINIKQWR